MECPVLSMEKEEAVSAIKKLVRYEPVPAVFEKCTFCFNCNRYCPVEGLRPHELILENFLLHREKIPGAFLYLANGRKEKNLFQDLYQKMRPKEKDILKKWSVPQKGKEALWVGCVGRLSCLDIEASGVLSPLFKFGPQDLCCGEIAYRFCSWDAYEKTIERTLEALENLQVERLVCYCGSCYNYLTTILQQVYGKKLPYPVISLYQWLWEEYTKGRLEIVSPANLAAGFHESCYISELEPDFRETLKKLYQAVGIRITDLPHNETCNLSCGAASSVRSLNPFQSLFQEQKKKYKEVSDTGMKNMALNCPGCFITLRFTSSLFGKKLMYMPEILLKSFGDEITVPLEKRIPQIAVTFVSGFSKTWFMGKNS